MNTLLSMHNVTIRYSAESEPVINALSLDIKVGERVALLGLNGSGKTTLLYAIVGLVPHQGTISFNGTQLCTKTERSIRDKIGFLFSLPEDQILFPKVIDDVVFSLTRLGMEHREAHSRAMQQLDKLGISHLAEFPPYRLSHGQKQRVALAGTLAAEPSLLLFDEPSSALDPLGKKSLLRLLNTTQATMVLATHDMDFANNACNRFILLEKGLIVEDACDGSKLNGYWS